MRYKRTLPIEPLIAERARIGAIQRPATTKFAGLYIQRAHPDRSVGVAGVGVGGARTHRGADGARNGTRIACAGEWWPRHR